MCQVLNVSRSGLRKHKKSLATVKKLDHVDDIINCFHKNKAKYGRVRIKRDLARQGIIVSEVKISRILSSNGLVSKYGRPRKRKAPKKTKSEYTSENLVKKKFEVKEINKLWCADISELKYKTGRLYISGIIDVGARRLVGWSIERHARQEIVHESIEMAVGRCQPEKDLIYHCDRGCQYTSNATKGLLDRYGFKSSMSRPGSPTDNQPIETFWKTLKTEMDDISKMNYKDAKKTIIKYIELEYNSDRLHSSLNYKTPNEVWQEQLISI